MRVRLEPTLRVAGGLHFAVLIASAMVPGVLDWQRELAQLSPLTQQLVWVHGAFIVLVIIGFGTLTLCNARALANGTALARNVCGFIGAFWAARLVLQFVFFEPGELIDDPLLHAGYNTLTVLFAYFAIVYAWAAIAPQRPQFGLWGRPS